MLTDVPVETGDRVQIFAVDSEPELRFFRTFLEDGDYPIRVDGNGDKGLLAQVLRQYHASGRSDVGRDLLRRARALDVPEAGEAEHPLRRDGRRIGVSGLSLRRAGAA